MPTLAGGCGRRSIGGSGLGDSYMLDLSSLFTDADGDPLAYEVRVGEAAYAAAEANYTYAPSESGGETVLTFRANDGTAYSTATYTVTLTVREPEERQRRIWAYHEKAQKQSATAQSLGDIPSGETSIGQAYVRIGPAPKSMTRMTPACAGSWRRAGWILPSDDMMSVIVRRGQQFAWVEGAESGYITSIGGLAQFDRGLMSGWMGTLNDWFVNEGFSSFSVANGTLAAATRLRLCIH